jgi:hypothetical protein
VLVIEAMAPKNIAKNGSTKKMNAEKELQPKTPRRKDGPGKNLCEGYNGQKCEFSVNKPGEPSMTNKGYKTCIICDPPRLQRMIEDKKLRNISPTFNALRCGRMEVLNKAVNRLRREEVMTIMFGGQHCVGAMHGLYTPCIFSTKYPGAPATVHDKSCHRCMFCCVPCLTGMTGMMAALQKPTVAGIQASIAEAVRADEEKRESYTIAQQEVDLAKHAKVIGKLVTRWHREAPVDREEDEEKFAIERGGRKYQDDPDKSFEGEEQESDNAQCNNYPRGKDGKFEKKKAKLTKASDDAIALTACAGCSLITQGETQVFSAAVSTTLQSIGALHGGTFAKADMDTLMAHLKAQVLDLFPLIKKAWEEISKSEGAMIKNINARAFVDQLVDAGATMEAWHVDGQSKGSSGK